MTREEAEVYARGMTYRDAVYNALQGKCIPYRKATFIKLYELLDKLEQEPCADAIGRQAVLDKKELVELEDGQSFYCISPEDVETLPPVNPQPKIGHWIFDEILDRHYYCSECKSMGVDYWDYCPNCGAKMEEVEE